MMNRALSLPPFSISPSTSFSSLPSPSAPLPYSDPATLRFKIVKVSKLGICQSRILTLNTNEGLLTFIDTEKLQMHQQSARQHISKDHYSPSKTHLPDHANNNGQPSPSRIISPSPPIPNLLPSTVVGIKSYSVNEVREIEKCHCDKEKNRVIFVFNDETKRAYDIIFVDQTTRDIFCELVASLNREILVRGGCGGSAVSFWVSDSEVSRCMKCLSEFGFTLRKHHCRSCGGVFCATCSGQVASLPDMGYRTPVRVCVTCFDSIRDARVMGLTGKENGVTHPHGYHAQTPFRGHHAPSAIQSLGGRNGAIIKSKGKAPYFPFTSSTINNNNALALPRQGPQMTYSSSTDSLSDQIEDHMTEEIQRSQTEYEAENEQGEGETRNPLPPSTGIPAKAHLLSPSPRLSSQPHPDPNLPRDIYGFQLNGDGLRGVPHSSFHLTHLIKQRKRWHNYLVLHPNLDKTPELRRLVRKGIPPELRGQVWQVLSGSKERALHATTGYYQQCLDTALQHVANSATSPNQSFQTQSTEPLQIVCEEIEKDLRRTFPQNELYETEEGISMLRRVLLAYAVHNPTVGYCQSMNFIAGLALLFMDEEEAFWLLSVIIDDVTTIDLPSQYKPDKLYYYQSDLAGVHIDQAVFHDLLIEKLPKIASHLNKLSLPVGPITVNWFLCLFVNTLPLETSLHMWDVLFSEGVKTLFRCALALLKVNERIILSARDFEDALLKAKSFHLAASESSLFMKMCFDPLWLGAFPMSRISQLRKFHRGRIVRELKERERQLLLNQMPKPDLRAMIMQAGVKDLKKEEKEEEEEEEEEVVEEEELTETDDKLILVSTRKDSSEQSTAPAFHRLPSDQMTRMSPEYASRLKLLTEYVGSHFNSDVIDDFYFQSAGSSSTKEQPDSGVSNEAGNNNSGSESGDENEESGEEDENNSDEENERESYVTVERPSSADSSATPSPAESPRRAPIRSTTSAAAVSLPLPAGFYFATPVNGNSPASTAPSVPIVAQAHQPSTPPASSNTNPPPASPSGPDLSLLNLSSPTLFRTHTAPAIPSPRRSVSSSIQSPDVAVILPAPHPGPRSLTSHPTPVLPLFGPWRGLVTKFQETVAAEREEENSISEGSGRSLTSSSSSSTSRSAASPPTVIDDEEAALALPPQDAPRARHSSATSLPDRHSPSLTSHNRAAIVHRLQADIDVLQKKKGAAIDVMVQVSQSSPQARAAAELKAKKLAAAAAALSASDTIINKIARNDKSSKHSNRNNGNSNDSNSQNSPSSNSNSTNTSPAHMTPRTLFQNPSTTPSPTKKKLGS